MAPDDSYQIPNQNSHPFRLRRIDLEYFKSIRKAAVELDPLSVVVGANSSGKSTLLQAVIAMCQAVRTADSSRFYPLNSELQSLGTYEDIYHFQVNSKNAHVKVGLAIYDPGSILANSVDGGQAKHSGPCIVEWSVLLTESNDFMSGLARIESQRMTVSSRYDGTSTAVELIVQDNLSESEDLLPLLGSLRPQQSRVEYYSNRWWTLAKLLLRSDISFLKSAARKAVASKEEGTGDLAASIDSKPFCNC